MTTLDYLLKNGGLREGRAKASGTTYLGIPGARFTSQSTQAYSIDRDRAVPFWVDTSVTVDQFVAEITTAGSASTTARPAIYKADTDLQPTTLVVDGGTIACDSTGVKTITLGSPSVLTPGRYFLAFNHNTGATFRQWLIATPTLNSVLGSASLCRWFEASRTYAAFPDPGPVFTPQFSTGVLQATFVLRVSVP